MFPAYTIYICTMLIIMRLMHQLSLSPMSARGLWFLLGAIEVRNVHWHWCGHFPALSSGTSLIFEVLLGSKIFYRFCFVIAIEVVYQDLLPIDSIPLYCNTAFRPKGHFTPHSCIDIPTDTNLALLSQAHPNLIRPCLVWPPLPCSHTVFPIRCHLVLSHTSLSCPVFSWCFPVPSPVLFQCGQINKIGWESKHYRQNLCTL